MRRVLMLVIALVSLAVGHGSLIAAEPARLKLLFLGDNGHHLPPDRFKQLQPAMAQRGIDLTYSDKMADLNAATLAKYDGLVIYANTTEIKPDQEQALLDFVANGKGFVPLHCASYCFLNSPKYIDLVGAQFQRHGTGVFRTSISAPDHPIMKGFRGFESWDETYVHAKHNDKDRVVLEFRIDNTGREPWTWVRTHGQGRVFYTAWGHDQRTWGNPGFQNLVERGIRWACGGDPTVVAAFVDRPEMTPHRKDVKPFSYVEADVPYYPPGKAWGTTEGGKRKMQLPLPPEESIKHFVTPVGFEVRLFASEPDLQGKPLAMAWDERGRLWICESLDYPNELQPRNVGRDRIRICEDTDGDGRADKFTVFAEQLSIPTSLTFARGGLICQNGTETVFLKDTNGDDRADERRVLISGWALGDTHGGVSNFRYGLDNWYWGMQGYNSSRPEYNGKQGQSFRQGFFRFKLGGGDKPVVEDVEFIRSTNNNTWGLGISEEGLIFGSTANGCPSVFMPIPNRYYEAVRGWSSSVLEMIAESNRFEAVTENVRQVDHHGGFTAGAGHALYTARAYPREYWNRTAFVCEPTGHLVATFVLRPDGAGFQAKNSWNLLASHDEWSAPIMAEVGPDGHVWVIDWYNYIVQHNPTPAGFKTGKGAAYESPLRDKKHARIYRVVHTAARPAEPLTLAGATAEKLVATLKHDNMLWRLQAQRLLVERGKQDVAAPLSDLVANSRADELGLDGAAIHALWTLQALGALDDGAGPAAKVAGLAAQQGSPAVKRNALAVLSPERSADKSLAALRATSDASPEVRLAALLKLAELPPSAEAADLAVEALVSPAVVGDRWLLDGATAAAARHGGLFLERLARSPHAARLTPPAMSRVTLVAEHLARGRGKADPAAAKELAGALSAVLIALGEAPTPVADAIVAGLDRGWPRSAPVELTSASESALARLLPKVPATSRGAVLSLANKLGSKELDKYSAEIAAGLLKSVQDEQQPVATRVSAARQLVEFRSSDPRAAAELLALLNPRTPPELGLGLVEATGRSDSRATAVALLERLGAMTPNVKAAAFRALLARSEWTGQLLDAIEQGKVQFTELSLDQRQGLAAHPDNQLALRARKLLAAGGGLPNADRQKVIDEMLALVQKAGDPKAGKEIFKKTCAKCHIHSGEGTKIGPDLTGMAVHPKQELLIHIFDPSRSVEGNFRVYTIQTGDGRVMTGLLASESKTAIEVIDAEAKTHVLQRADIEELAASTKSLMPDGFEKQLKPAEVTDLLEFLTQRGRYLPIPLDKVATINTTKNMFFDSDSPIERMIFPDWKPKVFEGVPFQLIDPLDGRSANAILFNGPNGFHAPKMPKTVTLPCNTPAKAIHMLSGVSGWGFPASGKGTVSLIVRLHYADGKTEDQPLKNGEHFADYIRRVDVPGSKFAYSLRGPQLRFLTVVPQRAEKIATIELVKGPDGTAPIVMAVTVETTNADH